jgi:Uma2 family endonuclease
MAATIIHPKLVLRSPDATWNYERWEKELPDDGNLYEVIDRVLYMTTAPSFFHQWIIQRLARFLGTPAEDQGLAYFATAPIGLLMPGCDPVQPDFVLILKTNADVMIQKRIHGVPDLIVETLSPNNQANDTDVKLHAYARAGLLEYIVVNPETRKLYRYRLAEIGHYADPEIFDEMATVTFDCLPAIPLRVADLFSGAPDTTL